MDHGAVTYKAQLTLLVIRKHCNARGEIDRRTFAFQRKKALANNESAAISGAPPRAIAL
jgi:hypothetical protein